MILLLGNAAIMTNPMVISPVTAMPPTHKPSVIQAVEAKKTPLTPAQRAQRTAALAQLGKITDRVGQAPQTAAKLVPTVVPYFKHPDSVVRVTAVQIIQRIGVAAKDTIPDLRLLLQDPDREVRSVVPFALAEMGYLAQDTVPDLQQMLRDPDVAFAANWALGHVDRATRTARLQALLTAIQSPDAKTRQDKAFELGMMKPKELIPQLNQLLKHQEPDVRQQAMSILASLNAQIDLPQAVPLEQEFILKPGETASIQDTKIKILFDSVQNDSRCPIDLDCYWAGNAEVKLVLQIQQEQTAAIINTGIDNRHVQYRGYHVQLLKLTPARHSKKPIRQSDYAATLKVSRVK